MSLQDLIRKYYVDPIALNQGYNVVNTLTYAILVVIVTYLTFRLFEKMKVKIDKNFVKAFLPLVLFGTFIRLFEEVNISKSYLLVTPMIWIETFIVVMLLFLISKYVERRFKIPYYKSLFAVGIILMLIPFVIVVSKVTSFAGMLITLGLLLPFAFVIYFVKWGRGNKLVMMSHIFDAVATFTAIQFFNFTELHVLPRFLIGNLGPISFVIVKVVVVAGVLILIDKYSDDKDFNNFLKFIIAIIGLGPAIRDFFLLGFI